MSAKKAKDEMEDDDWGDDGDDAGGGSGGGDDDDDGWGDDGDGAEKKKAKGKEEKKTTTPADDDDDGDAADWNDDGDSDGGGAAEEWENAEFDDDGGAGVGGGVGGGGGDMADDGDADAGLSVDIQVANLFYEAEDLVREKPAEALAKFHALLELCRGVGGEGGGGGGGGGGLSDESRTSLFASLVHIVVLSYGVGAVGSMVDVYGRLLEMIPKVTRNEGAEAIDAVLNAVSNSRDHELLTRIYSITSQRLQSMPDTERMLFNVNMRLCRTHIEREEYSKAQQVLDQLHAQCRLPNGEDDKKNKGAELIEIYALMIKTSTHAKDAIKMKALYEATKDLSAAVKDPRSQSIIRECWGLMFGDEGEWQRAYAEFYSAFIHYQEVGNRERAKQCLKYLVVANMLAGGEQNPFDAREAKVLQGEKDVAAIVGLRSAYEKCEVQAFNAHLAAIVADARLHSDTFIPHHLDVIVTDFHRRAIHRLVLAYRRVRLSHLAAALDVKVERVERLVVGLILDGQLMATIDRVEGWLDLTQQQRANAAKYDAIEQWTQQLHTIAHHITQPHMQAFT